MTYDTFAKPEWRNSAKQMQPLVAALHRLIERDKPRVIVSTFPLYSSLLEVVRRDIPAPPIITVITDSIEVHPAWVVAPSDLFCLPDEDTRASMLSHGIAAERLRITGFPVSLKFMRDAADPGPSPSILYMPSTDTAHVEQTLQGLRAQVKQGTRLTIVPGRHGTRLYHVLRRYTDAMPGAPVEVLSWTNDMPKLLQTHSLLVCKAGGAILHEALAARIPAVIDFVVPGQEEGNAELLTKHGCAVLSTSPTDTCKHVDELLANKAAKCAEMRERMKPLSVPDAANRVAALL